MFNTNDKKFKLSNQAIGALMMALQRSLLEQSDIVPVLEAWELANGPDGLVVENPPVLHSANIEEDTEESAVFNAWADKIGDKSPWQNE
tara:strand:- start:2691 stop:2957 length:267 start_codon:yes stop_codon:yes gene_type:complete